MEITEVQINLHEDNKLRAFANITLDDAFVVRGLKVICGPDRYFVAMPNRRKKDGSFSDIAHPINSDFRRKMEEIILERYWEIVGREAERG